MPRYLQVNVIIAVLFLIFAGPAASELYQYTDENGIMRLTDNIYSVPADSRAKLEQFSEFERISDKLEILPLNKKAVSPAKAEKTILPKTPKTMPADIEKKIALPTPAMDVDTKSAPEPETAPVPGDAPVLSEKEPTKPEPEVPVRDISISRRITIHRPAAELSETTGPEINETTILEPKTVKKEQTEKSTGVKPGPVLTAQQTGQPQKADIGAPERTPAKKVHIKPKKPEITTPVAEMKKSKAAETKPFAKKPAEKITDHNVSESSDTTEKKRFASAISSTEPVAEKAAENKIEPETATNPVTKQTMTAEETPPPNALHEHRTIVSDDGKTEIKKRRESATDKTDKKSAPPVKTAKADSLMNSEKNTLPETAHQKNDETIETTSGQPEKTNDIQSLQTAASSTRLNTDVKEKETIANRPKAILQKVSKELAEKNVKKITRADSDQKTIQKTQQETHLLKTASDEKIVSSPAVQFSQDKTQAPEPAAAAKVVTDQQMAAVNKTAMAQPELTPQKRLPGNPGKSIPEINKSDLTVENQTMPEKKSASLMAGIMSDKEKVSKTTTPKSPSAQAASAKPSPENKPGKTGLSLEKMNSTRETEADRSASEEKDENLILARLETTRVSLAEKKEALNNKYLRLMKEKQEIENSVNEDDEDSVLKYNENVKRLNLKIKQYKTEKKNLQAEIEKYNNEIRQLN